MSPLTIVLIVILVLVIAACIALYIFGKKAEKKQAAQREQMEAAAQVIRQKFATLSINNTFFGFKSQ